MITDKDILSGDLISINCEDCGTEQLDEKYIKCSKIADELELIKETMIKDCDYYLDDMDILIKTLRGEQQ